MAIAPVSSITVDGKTFKAPAKRKGPAKPKLPLTPEQQLKALKAEHKALKASYASSLEHIYKLQAEAIPKSLLQTLQELPSGCYDAVTENLIDRIRMRIAGQAYASDPKAAIPERVVSYDPAAK